MAIAAVTRWPRQAARVALSHYVIVGMVAAFGLLLVSTGVHLALGAAAAAAATVGVIVAIPSDQAAPRRGKLAQLLPGALLGVPLFFAVHVVRADALPLSALIVTASFFAFLAAAWGKRGLPISMSVMLAVIFALAAPASPGARAALVTSLHFALGAFAYVVYATLANAALNGRYRALLLADTLLATARLLRTQAQPADAPPFARVLAQQAALADQLQAARDLLLEAPRTPRRQQRAAMLIGVIELRDHLLACTLDLEALHAQPAGRSLLDALRAELGALALQLERLADALLLVRRPPPLSLPLPLPAVPQPAAAGSAAAFAAIERVGHLRDELARLNALARGDTAPDLAAVRAHWRLFVSPTRWSLQPLAGLWRWDAPPLRHAVRAALAIAAGQALALAMPWGTHDYWILLTIAVVLRGSLAQTLERRNARVAGTLLGCLLATLLLQAHTPPWLLLAVVTLAQGVAHAFAVRRYLVTAVAASVMALIQAHQLGAGTSPVVFEAAERLADTLIGVALAWVFSYVLPSWERGQLAALVARTLAAQAAHARAALGLLTAAGDGDEGGAEIGWRLARREAHDSLSALVQAARRALAEPRAVRPPLDALERLQTHGLQLLAQLTAVTSMLLLRRDRLDAARIGPALASAARAIEATLVGDRAARDGDPPAYAPEAAPGHDDFDAHLLQRLALARALARRMRDDADRVAPPAPPAPARA